MKFLKRLEAMIFHKNEKADPSYEVIMAQRDEAIKALNYISLYPPVQIKLINEFLEEKSSGEISFEILDLMTDYKSRINCATEALERIKRF